MTELLHDFSLEMTGKDAPAVPAAARSLPAGTHVNVTALGSESPADRWAAASAVLEAGLVPVPHISARRLVDRAALETTLRELRSRGAASRLFVVGGDPASPEGPYSDSLDVLRSGLLEQYGATHVGIAGYPEGHPAISAPRLWDALEHKAEALTEHALTGEIITQFGFDTTPVLTWLADVRARGIGLPVRVGVPGPAGIKRLMAFAARFGVASSAGIARKYGLSLTNLLGTAGPDRFLSDLAAQLDPAVHGEVKVHFYTFGGVAATAEWVAAHRSRS